MIISNLPTAHGAEACKEQSPISVLQASSAKRHRTKSLLKCAGKPDAEAPEEEGAAAESKDALDSGLEDSEASGAVGKPTQRAMLLDESDDDDSACSPKSVSVTLPVCPQIAMSESHSTMTCDTCCILQVPTASEMCRRRLHVS